MTEPTGKLPAPPANEETAAILEDFKALLRQTTGTEYAKQLLFPAVPNNREATTFKHVTTEASWRMYWLGRMGVVKLSSAPGNTSAAIEGHVPPVTARVDLQLPGLMNGIIRRLKARPGRYCLTSVALLARGALFFVDVDADGTVHQLTPEGVRDGELRDSGWRGDEFTLDPRLIEEFPGGAPVIGEKACPTCGGSGNVRSFESTPAGRPIACANTCPTCVGSGRAAVQPRPAARSTRTYVELGLSQPAYNEIREKLRAAGYNHAFGAEGEIDLHGLAAVVEPYAPIQLKGAEPGDVVDAEVPPPRPPKCDGNHGGSACGDPECWARPEAERPAHQRRCSECGATTMCYECRTGGAEAPSARGQEGGQ